MGSMTYMCKNRHGTYYARFIIPKHLQSHFDNKKEIRRSLQTDSRKLAIKRARIYRVEFESVVNRLMNNPDDTAERAKLIPDSLIGEFGAYEVTLKAKTLAILSNGEEKAITGEIKRNLASPDEDTTKHKEYLLNQVRKEAKHEEERAEREQRQRRAEEKHQAELKAIATAPAQTTTIPINPKKLSEYLKDFITFKTASTTKKKLAWTSPDTIDAGTRDLTRFCLDANDIPAAAFNCEEADRYIKLAHNIPAYLRNKVHIEKKFTGVTVESILDDSIDTSMLKTRKPSTICNDLKKVRAFLDWMRTSKRVKELQDAIGAFDAEIKLIDSTSSRRNFTHEELKILFEDNNPSAENYVKGFNSKRGVDANLKYWLPLLGLYTGATIAELCQLHLSDIRQHKAFDGSEHWVIDINTDSEKCAIDDDIRLKNTSGRPRLIPVHKVLLDLGFTDYVQTLTSKSEVELFPLSKRSEHQYGKGSFGPESQWWGLYSGKAGVDDSDVVFHSFRHNMTTCLKINLVDREVIAAIDGHSGQSTADKYYKNSSHRDSDIGPLADAINKVDYGLTHQPFKELGTPK